MENLLEKIIVAVQNSEMAYCKFLAANDTKITNSNQSGYLIGKSAWKMFLDKEPQRGENIKLDVEIKWQDSFYTNSKITYYGRKKDEFRLTQFGRGFPFREDENVGDLLILIKIGDRTFSAFILSHDEEIDDFFSSLNISPTHTNKLIPKQFQTTSEDKLKSCFFKYLKSLAVDFPPTLELATRARDCYTKAYGKTKQAIISNSDKELLNWLNAEFELFKIIENDRYLKRIQEPFNTVEELVDTANTILNRRKSRAGKSLEHHLSEVFKTFDLKFETQKVTEDNKKPDFIFPDLFSYQNARFDDKKLVVLACKTTCKDRWRQILNEADRVKIKYLFTLQPGISRKQLTEMYKYHVRVVAPKENISNFPPDFKNTILSLQNFMQFIKSTQE